MFEWREIVRGSKRYKNFVLLDVPMPFYKLFADQDISCVQLHSTQVFGKEGERDIVGFCGTFRWEGGEITSLDGDSYSKDAEVLGYSWFTNGHKRCLDILVGDDW